LKHFRKIYESEEYRIADSFVISTEGKTLDTGIQGGSIYYWDVNDEVRFQASRGQESN
jgi:hypothetical protein